MNWKETLKKESFSTETQMRIAENRAREVQEMVRRDKQHNRGQPITPDGKPLPLSPVEQRLAEELGNTPQSKETKERLK